jgi:putative DNA primase/helicase
MGNISDIIDRIQERSVKHPIDQLRQAMMDSNMEPPDQIIADGNIKRFGRKKSCWYVMHESGELLAGAFGNWQEGVAHTFRSDIGRALSAKELFKVESDINLARQKMDKEIETKRKAASESVNDIWAQCAEASDDHPYLLNKKVKAHGIRVTGDGRLVIPVYDENDVMSLQYIDSKGEKRFHTGGKIEGGVFVVGGSVGGQVYVAEGYADAATIYESTGIPCVVAFNASNIPRVCEAYKGIGGIVFADNDEHGVGERYANQSTKYGFRVVMPSLGMDVNDYVSGGGDLNDLIDANKKPAWLTGFADLRGQPAPLKWMIKNWVQDDSLIMLHGPPGCGKSFLVLDWCLRIASGKTEWMGNKVNPGSVVYLAGEGHHGFRGRIEAWVQANECDSADFFMSSSGCDLNKPEGLQRVYDSLGDLPESPSVVVVDTLHRFMSGDENSAQDAKEMLDACNAIMRDFNCTVILVHHTGVSEEAQHRARGSSAWRGALDIEISVVGAKDDKPMEIIQRKAKDSEMAPTVYARLEKHYIDGWFDEDGEKVGSLVMSQARPPEQKEDKAIHVAKNLFREMWHKSGKEKIDGAPFVSFSFAQSEFEQMGHSVSTSRIYARGNNKGPLWSLEQTKMIARNSYGWVCEQTLWCLLLNGEK